MAKSDNRQRNRRENEKLRALWARSGSGDIDRRLEDRGAFEAECRLRERIEDLLVEGRLPDERANAIVGADGVENPHQFWDVFLEIASSHECRIPGVGDVQFDTFVVPICGPLADMQAYCNKHIHEIGKAFRKSGCSEANSNVVVLGELFSLEDLLYVSPQHIYKMSMAYTGLVPGIHRRDPILYRPEPASFGERDGLVAGIRFLIGFRAVPLNSDEPSSLDELCDRCGDRFADLTEGLAGPDACIFPPVMLSDAQADLIATHIHFAIDTISDSDERLSMLISDAGDEITYTAFRRNELVCSVPVPKPLLLTVFSDVLDLLSLQYDLIGEEPRNAARPVLH